MACLCPEVERAVGRGNLDSSLVEFDLDSPIHFPSDRELLARLRFDLRFDDDS